MRLGNKILTVILGLLLLNLASEYIWIKDIQPPKTESAPFNIDFDVKSKEYDPIKPIQISLPLLLRGTIIGGSYKSFAIIEDLTNKTQDLYKLGDIINGAKLVAMNRNRVILDYNGNKQELSMNEANMAEAGPRPDVTSGQGPASAMSAVGLDFTKILTQLRIKPYFEDGKCVGFQLSNINNGFIRQMGLKDGDIIETINGVQINDPLRALQVLYSLERDNPVRLGIERRDEKIELDCKVEG